MADGVSPCGPHNEAAILSAILAELVALNAQQVLILAKLAEIDTNTTP
jgi:hypothetical protein